MVEPLFKLALPNSGLYFMAGPSFGFNIEGSFENTKTETLPGDYTWAETGNNKKSAKTKGSMKDLLVRFELKFGAGFDIPVSSLMTLTPQLGFGFGFTKVQSDVSWRILTLQALGTVKFRLI